MPSYLFLWSFESEGGELYALSTGRVPPAEEHLIKDWKRLEARVELSEEAIKKITYERPSKVLGDVERQGYHTLTPKMLNPNWVRPVR